MKREEKQQKFHQALLRVLYPPPQVTLSSLSLAVFLSPFDLNPWSFIRFVQAEGDEEGKLKNSTDSSYYLPDAGELEDGNRNSSSSSSDDDDNGENGNPEKLTRSQRKRFRKSKLREAASRRKEIIGPLLPNSKDDGNDGGADRVGATLQSVGQNTDLGSSALTNNSGAPAFCTKKNKIKQRRKAKKL